MRVRSALVGVGFGPLKADPGFRTSEPGAETLGAKDELSAAAAREVLLCNVAELCQTIQPESPSLCAMHSAVGQQG